MSTIKPEDVTRCDKQNDVMSPNTLFYALNNLLFRSRRAEILLEISPYYFF